MLRFRFLVTILVACLTGSAALAEGIAPGTPWTQPHFTRLDVSFPGGDYHARWDFDRCDCGDVLVRTEETLPDGLVTGEQLLVGGRVLLQRGFAEPGPAHLDSPMLMLQLLLVLLQKAAPVSPALVEAPQVIAASDDENALLLDTGTAHGGFPPPWKVVGEVRRVEDGSHRFGLEFQFDRNSPAGTEIQLSGALDYRPRPFPRAGEMSLSGWSVVFLDQQDEEAGTGWGVTTLAELRRFIERRGAP